MFGYIVVGVAVVIVIVFFFTNIIPVSYSSFFYIYSSCDKRLCAHAHQLYIRYIYIYIEKEWRIILCQWNQQLWKIFHHHWRLKGFIERWWQQQWQRQQMRLMSPKSKKKTVFFFATSKNRQFDGFDMNTSFHNWKPLNLVSINCKRNKKKYQPLIFNRIDFLCTQCTLQWIYNIFRFLFWVFIYFFLSLSRSLNVTGTWHQFTLHETSIFVIAPENRISRYG